MKYILILMLIFLGSSLAPCGKIFAHIENIYFLKGKVGERELAMKMLVYDEMPDRHITYFFLDDKKDKHLKGRVSGDLWVFLSSEEKENGAAKPGVALRIAEGANGDWKGVWSDSTGRSWDVTLKTIVPDSISSKFDYLQYVQELDPYQRYKLSDINFFKIKTENKTPELACDWYLEKESGIVFFRIRSRKNKINPDELNANLETINLSMIQEYFSFNPDRIDSKVEANLLYLSDELLSFKVLSKNTFKTQKTSLARQLLTYDIMKGKRVDLESLIWFDQEGKEVNPEDLDRVYKYRKEVFAPKLFKMLSELYPEKMKSDSCDLNKVDTWVLPAWSLMKKGISFGFFTVDECNVHDWAMVPYKTLKPFIQSKYQLKAKK